MNDKILRTGLFTLLLLTSLVSVHGQLVCFSDSTTIYEFPAKALPTLFGEASFQSGHYKVIVGGQFVDSKAPDSTGIYNCDMLVVDEQAGKMYVLPLSYFPPYVADQFAGINYGYTMDNDTAYIMGGYGYNLSEGYETTFPTLTIFPVKTLIDSVIHHKDYFNLFEVIDDQRLAVTEGTLLHIGQYFLVYGGKQIVRAIEEYTDCMIVKEWDFHNQMRKFRLNDTEGYPELDEFQICNSSKVFYQCMPSNWKGEPTKVRELYQQDK